MRLRWISPRRKHDRIRKQTKNPEVARRIVFKEKAIAVGPYPLDAGVRKQILMSHMRNWESFEEPIGRATR